MAPLAGPAGLSGSRSARLPRFVIAGALALAGGLAALFAVGVVATLLAGDDAPPATGARRPAPTAAASALPLLADRNPVEVADLDVGPAGGALQLKDGAQLTVPAGALAAQTTLKVERFEPGLETVDFTVGSSALYRLTLAGDDHRTLNPPATLRIPWAPDRTVVVSQEGDKWVGVRTAGGDAVTVYIDHFSTRTLLAIGASLASGLRTVGEQVAGALPRTDLRPGIRDLEAKHRERIRTRSAATQQFYGVGEVTTRTHAAICEEFKTALTNRQGLTFGFPDKNPGVVTLTKHLGDAGKPSAGDSDAAWFWNATKASHDTIRQKIIAAGLGHPISPAAVLRIAIEANGGSVPLGVLAAHNLLKNIAYEGRVLADPNDTYTGGIQDVTPADGQLAASIETWRRGTSYSPSGRYDKMGPLYHIFAAMTGRLWGGAAYGQTIVTGEVVLRGIGWGSDIPDPDKGAADECGLDIGGWLATLQEEVSLGFEPVTARLEPAKPIPLTLTIKNLPPDGVSVGLAVTSGQATLSRTGVSASRGKSSSTCDVTGPIATCGFTITPANSSSITVEARWGKIAATVVLGGEVCIEGTPSPIPLSGGIQRIRSSRFSICFPESGGPVSGRITYDVDALSGTRVGNGPLDVDCTYRAEITYELPGTYAAPGMSGKATASFKIDTATLAGKDCSSDRKNPGWGPVEAGPWSGTFETPRLKAAYTGPDGSKITMEGAAK